MIGGCSVKGNPMDLTIVPLWTISDDLLIAIGHQEHPQAKMSDVPEVMTAALVAARYFGGNQHTAVDYCGSAGPPTMDPNAFATNTKSCTFTTPSLFTSPAIVGVILNCEATNTRSKMFMTPSLFTSIAEIGMSGSTA